MHQRFTVIFGKMNLLIWALIVVPLAPMFSFVFAVLRLEKLNTTLLLTGIMGCMALSVVLLLWLIRKHLSLEAVITTTDDGLKMELMRTNIFYPRKEIIIPLSNIRNFSLNYDARSGQQFVVLRLARGANLQISASRNAPDDLQAFQAALVVQQERYNSNPALQPGGQIGNTSFYETGFGRLITGAIIIGTIMVTVNQLVGTGVLPWYKVIWWYAIAAAWLVNVWYARQKKMPKDD
jgi:hypothetical protein